MSGKLDKSLDDIVSSRRQTARRGRGGRAGGTTRAGAKAAAPVGGVAKTNKAAKTAGRKTVAIPTSATGESKIIVSGLPSDVSEAQIKDYFAKTIGPVKKVFLTYGPNGQSRGVSTIVFAKPGAAQEAAASLNGVKVDNRAMKIEVILNANQVTAPVAPKGLGDRVAKPKPATAAAKASSADTKMTDASSVATRGGSRGGRGKRGRNAGRGKPKTAQELDAEMTDYFVAPGSGGEANGGAVAASNTAGAAGADAGMDDEIM